MGGLSLEVVSGGGRPDRRAVKVGLANPWSGLTGRHANAVLSPRRWPIPAVVSVPPRDGADRQQAIKAHQLQDTEHGTGRYCQPWLAAVGGCLVISQQQAADARGGQKTFEVRSAIMMATRNWSEA